MKKQIEVTMADGKIHRALFPNEEFALQWLEEGKENGMFGKNEKTFDRELTPAVVDAEGNVTTPATFETVTEPADYTYEMTDVADQSELEKRIEALTAKGEVAAKASERAYNLIAGFNLDRQLTSAQINQMQQTFAPIIGALNAKRPGMAKGMIQNIAVDGTIVTQEMKDLVLHVLADWEVPA